MILTPNLLHTKWVYKTKRCGDGQFERFKARLVACGNEQLLGIDSVLTFAAVMGIGNIKVILMPSMIWGVRARRVDVPETYVKAMTEDEYDIQLYIPDGMKIPAELLRNTGVTSVKELLLRLKRILYGLKQAGRLWHQLLRKTLLELEFIQCITDTCIFCKVDNGGTTAIGTYVDDLLVTVTSTDRVNEFFAEMQVLELKDLWDAAKFLGMQVDPGGAGCMLHQASMIGDMITRFGLENAYAVRLLIGEEQPDLEGEVPVTSGGGYGLPSIREFHSLVGSLLWVARCIRPDIGVAVHRATRKRHAPTPQD